MLTKEAIQLFALSVKNGHGARVFRMRLMRHVELMVSGQSQMIYPDGYERTLKERLLMEHWYYLYGDIIKSIPKLHDDCLLNLDRRFISLNDNPVEQGFRDLMAMLKPPMEWLEDLQATVISEKKQ